MNKNSTIIIVLIICVLLGTGFAFTYKSLQEEKKKRKAAEQANIRLIINSIQRQKGFSEVVKQELGLLAERFKTIDPDITNKIAKAIQLININQTENAIEDLAVIMENLLEEYYRNDNAFSKWLKNRRADLHNLLTYCKIDKKIDEIELQFFLGVKTIRNKEDHKLNLNLADYLKATGLLVGIGAIVKIASFWEERKRLNLDMIP